MTLTTDRMLYVEARVARLEDWVSVARAKARELSRVGLNALLLVALWAVVNLGSLFERGSE